VSRGQALIELAICAPVMTLLALGAVALVQVTDAKAGLEGATQAAAAAAARAPDADAARVAGEAQFRSVIDAYPLAGARLKLSLGSFERGTTLTAESAGAVEVGWAGILGLPQRIALSATAKTRIDSWRTHPSLR
jgi:Flp pilus assembly protein TadG